MKKRRKATFIMLLWVAVLFIVPKSVKGQDNCISVEIKTEGYVSVIEKNYLGNDTWRRIAETPGKVKIIRDEPVEFRLKVTACDKDLDEIASLREIQNLHFSFGGSCSFITKQGFQRVNELPNIHALELSGWKWFSGRELKHLKSLSRLKSISLYYCFRVRDSTLEHVVDAFPNLESIDLQTSMITDRGLEIISSLKNLRNLELGQCHRITDAGLRNLRFLRNIEVLDLSQCGKITDAGLRHLSNFHNLRSLELGSCEKITGTGLSCLADSKSLKKLRLGCCKNLTDDSLKNIVVFTELEYLSLAGCEQITDNGVRYLTQLPRLRVLAAPDNISTRSYEYFSRMTNMEYIFNIDYENLSEEERKYLEKMPKLVMPEKEAPTDKTVTTNWALFAVCVAVLLLLIIIIVFVLRGAIRN